MLKILILEDNAEKLKKITQALSQITSIDTKKIKTATNSHDVKVLLRKENFDVFILDLAIPPTIDTDVDQDGGTKLLQEIIQGQDRYSLPEHIIGITGFRDVYDASFTFFSSNCKILIYYDVTSDEWEEQLRNGVIQIISSKSGILPGADEFESKLAIACAMKDPELNAILDIDWNWEEIEVKNDTTRFFRGHFIRDEEVHRVYAAASSRMGLTSGCILANKLINNFKPEYLAMTGMTAGIHTKTNYGDIIAVETSWDWGSGKWTSDERQKLKFLPSPHHIQLSVNLRNKFLKLKEDYQILAAIKQRFPGEKPESDLKLRVGPMASGAAVLADGQTIEQIAVQHRNVIAVEMETYAIFATADEAKMPRPIPFSLKSVVDFGDTKKNDSYQKYASYTSAQALRIFMEKYL